MAHRPKPKGTRPPRLPRRRGPPPSLLADANFLRYWAGQAISAFGDAFAFVAYPLLVLEATGSVAAMGGVSAASALSQLVTGLVAGPVVDAADRRRLMIVCDLGRWLVYGVVPVYWWLRGPSLPLLYATTVVGSALGNLFAVAYVTATPDLVDRERLTEANGRLQGSQGLAFVLGPMLAGIVASRLGSVWAIGIDALTFALSAVSLAGVRLRREGKAAPVAGASFRALDGLRFLKREPQLRAVTVTFVLLAVLSSGTMAIGILDVIIFHLRNVLGASERVVGLSLGVGAVGAVVGALSAASLRRRFGFKPCFVGATLVQGCALLTMGTLGPAALLAAGAAAWTAGMSVRGVVTQTLRQELTPEALLGRVTAAFWTLAAVLAPVGAAFITGVAARWGTMTAFRVAGAGVAIVGLVSSVLLVTSEGTARDGGA